jgi:hypothetical protein
MKINFKDMQEDADDLLEKDLFCIIQMADIEERKETYGV